MNLTGVTFFAFLLP